MASDQPVRVALHINHPPLRSGVTAALEQSLLARVVADDASAEVVVCDGSTPGPTTRDSVLALCARHSGSRLVLLSVHEDATFVWKALDSGAAGYVLADWAGKDLVKAVLAVHQGRVYVSPRLRWTVAKALDGADSTTDKFRELVRSLGQEAEE